MNNQRELAEATENALKPKSIRLHVNELPWGIHEGFEDWEGPSLSFNRVELNRYPDSDYNKLREAVANYVGVKKENICLGNGSDELIGLIFMGFVKTEESILMETPTFGEYERAARLLRQRVVKVNIPEGKSGEARLARIKMQLALEGSKNSIPGLIVLCNPNNPTGELLSRESLVDFMRNYKGYVLLDEAYIDFCQEESLTEMIREFPKLIVLRTFSKGFGLAGIRLGYSVSSIEIAKVLNEIRPPYNINGITEYVALEALREPGKFRNRINKIIEERDRITRTLKAQKIPYVKPFGNFILVEGEKVWGANYKEKLMQRAKEKNILIRFFEKKEARNCFRFSVGKKEENDLFLEVLKSL